MDFGLSEDRSVIAVLLLFYTVSEHRQYLASNLEFQHNSCNNKYTNAHATHYNSRNNGDGGISLDYPHCNRWHNVLAPHIPWLIYALLMLPPEQPYPEHERDADWLSGQLRNKSS